MTREGLGSALERDLGAFARHTSVLIALDFDGTIAFHGDDPESVRAIPEAVEVIAGLRALPATVVALVSGRAVASLLRVAPVTDDMPLIGSHGLEVRLGAGGVPPVLDPGEQQQLRQLRDRLAALVATVEGAWIEDKPAGFAIHSRRVEPQRETELHETLRHALAPEPGLTLRAGRNILEVAMRDATKGDGIRMLRAQLRPDAVLFAGDDVTDEDAFAALEPGDVGIKVGVGATRARHRVAGPDDVVGALRHLLRVRQVLGSAR